MAQPADPGQPDRPTASLPVSGAPYEVPHGAPVHSRKTGQWTPSGKTQTINQPHVTRLVSEGSGVGYLVVRWPSGTDWKQVVIVGDQFVEELPGGTTWPGGA